ncbi:MAG: hypothetical protein C4531_06415 [Desulfurivibrio sp.]|nr:MAG: hypothetical protein C4531_06415 [Desulfurivibrio sp.]
MPRPAITKTICFLVFLLQLTGTAGQAAESTGGCHCFKQRSFNPAEPFAADEYLLATSFNSLLAKAFGVSKQQIVMLKMRGGVGSDDLLIGLQAAQRTGSELQVLLDSRKSGHSWPEILAAPAMAAKINGDELLEKIGSGLAEAEAGRLAADGLLARFFSAPPAEVASLRKAGLQEKEMTLLLLLAHVSGKSPAELAAGKKQAGKSWSETAFALGITPTAAGKLILQYPDKTLPK